MALQKLPTSGLDDINQRRRRVETLNNVLDFSFDDSRIRTPAEIAAGVTPINPAYPPGDVRRYGAIPGGVVDCSAAFQAAIDQADEDGGAAVFIPAGTWLIASALAGVRGLKMTGAGRFRSVVVLSGSINFLTYTGTGGHPDGGSMVFRDFTVKGSATSGNHIELDTAGQVTFQSMAFWLCGGSGMVVLNGECHEVTFKDVKFQSWGNSAILTDGLNSELTIEAVQFNIVGSDAITQQAGSACIQIDSAEGVIIKGCNVNGDDTLDHFLRIVSGMERSEIGPNYCERVDEEAIITDTNAVLIGVTFVAGQISCAGTNAIDISAGNPAHRAIQVWWNRRPETGGALFSPGSGIIDYDYRGAALEAGCDDVVGFGNTKSVRKYADGRIELNGNPSTDVTTDSVWTFAEALVIGERMRTAATARISPAQITANQNDYEPTGFLAATVIRLTSDASRNITGFGRDGGEYVKFIINVGTNDIVLKHDDAGSAANKRIRTPGGVDLTLPAGHSAWIWYDSSSDRWRPIAGTATV